MKQTKKGLSFLLAIAMVLSLAYGPNVKAAATSVTITLRVEQDEDMVAAPVQITLTDEDTQTGFGMNLATGPAAEVATPLHALAKYMKSKGATDDTMNQYITADFTYGSAYITKISSEGKCGEDSGGNAASGSQDNVYWMFAVNNASPSDPETKMGYAADQYILKQNDMVVFYGLWSPYPAEDETLYGYFDQTSYTVEAGKPLTVTLNGSGTRYDEQYNPTAYTTPVSDGVVVAAPYKTADSSATRDNASLTTRTGADGRATLTFKKTGSYVISAYRYAADGIHFTLSRPYARITVTEPKVVKPVDDKKDKTENTIKKPAKVTKVKVTVKKSGKKKKNVVLSWKKVKNATGYQVYVSKKRNKGYKKKASVKKKQASIRLSKGTYYIRVRACIKSGSTVRYGAYSDPKKVRVKK